MFSSIANQLTLSRILIIPVITLFLDIPTAWAAWTSLGLFTLAGITDYLDGYLARRTQQVSMIGQFLDPIADKLLVSAVILMLVYNGQIQGMTVFPAVVILLREVAVSGLREYLAGVQVSMPVSRLAKWKTTIQMLALGFLIVGKYAPDFIPSTTIGDVGLWLAATLTAVTAWDYWRASLKHFKN
ncbi:MAG: CDP-diacylglycerol--glycerol-3-phosphate 3-phosphatidyltransferase [Alphaproteobacteria bacterium]|nr:CDP-diacylglycerol--glycerol-3-phosphate 3-phosphatidyltransferase [Alphaproteobacteria bacterium]MBV8547947.1 CDP-diacylglycerol--glycerol-3-phosphate 3-phosphatidyltransferase [Alphaproteobacteria bacterium]